MFGSLWKNKLWETRPSTTLTLKIQLTLWWELCHLLLHVSTWCTSDCLDKASITSTFMSPFGARDCFRANISKISCKMFEACNQHPPQMSIPFSVFYYAPSPFFSNCVLITWLLAFIKQTLTTLCLVLLPFLRPLLLQALVLLNPQNN